jgi:hypothetical protein
MAKRRLCTCLVCGTGFVVAPNLRKIAFSRVDVAGEAMVHLAAALEAGQWPGLVALSLNTCGLGDADVARLAAAAAASGDGFPALRQLELADNPALRSAGIVALGDALAAGCFPRLAHLTLTGCAEIGDAGFVPLAQALAAPVRRASSEQQQAQQQHAGQAGQAGGCKCCCGGGDGGVDGGGGGGGGGRGAPAPFGAYFNMCGMGPAGCGRWWTRLRRRGGDWAGSRT